MAVTSTRRPPDHTAAVIIQSKPAPSAQDGMPTPLSPKQVRADNAIHLYRLDGVGDMIFMEPAVRKLKAQFPEDQLILHTRSRYVQIGEFIGFDAVIPCDTKRGGYNDGINLNWALEHHAASRLMDRVTVWEDILRVPCGDEPVSFGRGAMGKDMLASHPRYSPDKPSLYLSPFSVYRERSVPPGRVSDAIGPLTERFNVVTAAPPSSLPKPDGVDAAHYAFLVAKHEALLFCASMGCVSFPTAGLADWVTLVAACDVALSSDTGGMYVAAASGIPTVGLFEHVEPWLRLKRFPGTRGVLLRDQTCQCDHHGPCTKTRETCHETLTPAFLLAQVEAVLDGETGYVDGEGKPLAEPLLDVVIVGGNPRPADRRRTEFSVRDVCRGINYRMCDGSSAPPSPAPYATCRMEVPAGTLLNRDDVWARFTQSVLPQPGGKP
jgi:hypothetical protein